MKPRTLVLAWTIALLASAALLSSLFVSSAQTGVQTNVVRVSAPPTPPVVHAPANSEERDVDSGPHGRGNMSFQDYLKRREQMIDK